MAACAISKGNVGNSVHLCVWSLQQIVVVMGWLCAVNAADNSQCCGAIEKGIQSGHADTLHSGDTL